MNLPFKKNLPIDITSKTSFRHCWVAMVALLVSVNLSYAGKWTNDARNLTWDANGNWQPAVIPNSSTDVVFSQAGNQTIRLTKNNAAAMSIIFTGAAGNYTIGDNTNTLAIGGTVDGGILLDHSVANKSIQTFGTNIKLNASASNQATFFTNEKTDQDSALVFGNIANESTPNPTQLILQGSGSGVNIINGVISGNVSVQIGGGPEAFKQTRSIWKLAGDNTFTGGLKVFSGTVILSHNKAASKAKSGYDIVLGGVDDSVNLTGQTPAGATVSVFLDGKTETNASIIVGQQRRSAPFNVVLGGTNTSGTTKFSGGFILFTEAKGGYTTTLQAATGGVVVFAGGMVESTYNRPITFGSTGNAGTVRLDNAIKTTSGLTVKNGTLLINGTNVILADTDVTVSGGTLDCTTRPTMSLGGNLTMSSGAILIGGESNGRSTTYSLSENKNFTMTGGTVFFGLGSASGIEGRSDQIVGKGGTFHLSGGTIDLSDSDNILYDRSYQLFAGFSAGNVVSINITGFDTARYRATLSNTGMLSFKRR